MLEDSAAIKFIHKRFKSSAWKPGCKEEEYDHSGFLTQLLREKDKQESEHKHWWIFESEFAAEMLKVELKQKEMEADEEPRVEIDEIQPSPVRRPDTPQFDCKS